MWASAAQSPPDRKRDGVCTGFNAGEDRGGSWCHRGVAADRTREGTRWCAVTMEPIPYWKMRSLRSEAYGQGAIVGFVIGLLVGGSCDDKGDAARSTEDPKAPIVVECPSESVP